jgi:hypothetical protein
VSGYEQVVCADWLADLLAIAGIETAGLKANAG